MSRCGDPDDDAFSLPSNQDQVAADETFMSVGTDLLCSGSTSTGRLVNRELSLQAQPTHESSTDPPTLRFLNSSDNSCFQLLPYSHRLSEQAYTWHISTPGNTREPLRHNSDT